MKKLLLLLFSVMISFTSYGEWTELGEEDDGTFYIDLDTFTISLVLNLVKKEHLKKCTSVAPDPLEYFFQTSPNLHLFNI